MTQRWDLIVVRVSRLGMLLWSFNTILQLAKLIRLGAKLSNTISPLTRHKWLRTGSFATFAMYEATWLVWSRKRDISIWNTRIDICATNASWIWILDSGVSDVIDSSLGALTSKVTKSPAEESAKISSPRHHDALTRHYATRASRRIIWSPHVLAWSSRAAMIVKLNWQRFVCQIRARFVRIVPEVWKWRIWGK